MLLGIKPSYVNFRGEYIEEKVSLFPSLWSFKNLVT